jgi:hypothetical protein
MQTTQCDQNIKGSSGRTRVRLVSSATDISSGGLVVGSLQTNGNCLVPSSQRNEEDTSLGNPFEGPSPNRKRAQSSTHLAASGQMAPDAAVSDRSVEEDDGRGEQHSKPSLCTRRSAALTHPVQEEPTRGEIPSGWTHAKLEPDC